MTSFSFQALSGGRKNLESKKIVVWAMVKKAERPEALLRVLE
jgi:hypothetical protein